MDISDSTEVIPVSPVLTTVTYELSMLVLLVPLCLLSLLGLVTNSINSVVFIKQGLTSDSTTLSLFALTLSDLLGCLFMLPHPVCFYLQTLVVTDDPVIRNCLVLSTMTATYPHIICTQITCWITVYISVERAICVLFPLRVKLLIQYKNTVIILVFLTVAEIACHVPFILNCPFLWLPDPSRNSSYIVVNSQTPTGFLLYELSNLIESSILTSAAMFIIAMATVAIITRVRTSSAWRTAMSTKKETISKASKTQSSSEKRISVKDKEAVKVIASVAMLFLACLSFSHIPGLAMYMIPQFSLDGYNKDLFQLFYSFKFNLDALNASINFFFYVKQSTKYRQTLFKLFYQQFN
ncbi:growth hormone secretagogue receptor type 1 [Biomphalaria glabrata]|nr:growth hormone secretagogue receptor type 1 [Biomphalaria glabrata]